MTNLLEVHQLSLSITTGHILQRKKTILDRISFSVPRGSATAYLGKNGAGKTSTFRLLCGMVRADSGEIYFDNQPCDHGIPPNRFGFMPEQPYFYHNLTPRAMLTGFGRLSGMRLDAVRFAITQWAEKLHIQRVLDQPLSACSKGQIQRIGLVQALMHRPDFILLDEPMSGLDPMGRECVQQVMHEEVQRGASILFSSHILADAENLCDHVIILENGKTTFSGTITDLTTKDDQWQIRCRHGEAAWASIPNISAKKTANQQWLVTCPDRAQRDMLLQRLLAMAEVTIVSVNTKRKTLEQAFIDLVSDPSKKDGA
ncbi:MAG: ABC transporter ATP-binding protein [Mariprofundales bacterium]|nr:ABC transporter ATP-binding protein [Mariprofundales bacterium]